MIPTDLTTVNVKMNGMAFAHILSLAEEQLKTKRHVLKYYPMSEESFDRTVDAIHVNALSKDYDYYNSLIGNLKTSLKKNGVSV